MSYIQEDNIFYACGTPITVAQNEKGETHAYCTKTGEQLSTSDLKFGKVYGGTVKNLTVKNFSSDGEFTPTGVIAAYAADSSFENIAKEMAKSYIESDITLFSSSLMLPDKNEVISVIEDIQHLLQVGSFFHRDIDRICF